MLADFMTKALSLVKFKACCAGLGICDWCAERAGVKLPAWECWES
jgi:hypothetical protein